VLKLFSPSVLHTVAVVPIAMLAEAPAEFLVETESVGGPALLY
jgi:hypothetical protein